MTTGKGDLRGVCTAGIEWSGRPEPTVELSRGDGVRAARRSQGNPLDLWSNRLNEGIYRSMSRRPQKHRHRWGAWKRGSTGGTFRRCTSCDRLQWKREGEFSMAIVLRTGYTGTCPRCGEPITPDQTVETYGIERGYRHRGCEFPKIEPWHHPEGVAYGRKKPRGQLRRGVPGRT